MTRWLYPLLNFQGYWRIRFLRKGMVTEGMEIPDGSMVLGMPGKIKKTLGDDEQKLVSLGAHHYIENYKKYKETATIK